MVFSSILVLILSATKACKKGRAAGARGLPRPTVAFWLLAVVEEPSIAAKGKPETSPQNKEKIRFYFPKLLTGLSLFTV